MLQTQSSPAVLATFAHPPLPPREGLPLVGALPMLLHKPLEFLLSARERSGDVYRLDAGVGSLIALNHPSHAQHVLRDRARNYRKGGPLWDSLRALLGNGLPVSEGDFWLRQRRLVQPQFHRQRLAAMMELMVQAIDEGLDGWAWSADEGTPLDVAHELPRITMKVAVKTLFGSDIPPEEADAVSGALAYALDYVLVGALTQSLPQWVPAPGRKRFQEAVRTIDEMIFRAVERRRVNESEDGNLLGLLLGMVDAETGEGMTQRQLRDEVVSLFLAGYETTSLSLAFTFGLLAERPELARALREEHDAALGEASRPGFAHLPRMPLARRVFQEALRLYPPSYWLPRTAIEDDVIDGFHIPAGSTVALMTYVIHHHPQLWEEPERFDPERFAPERSAGRHPLAWMPFGAGQRQCVGMEFALMEGQLILSRALSRFALEKVAGREVRSKPSTTLRPRDGVWVRLRRAQGRATGGGGAP